MPVRSSLCTYSPAASKYSTGSAGTSSLSYGHYKPLTSSYKSPSSYSPTISSDPPASSTRSLSSRYSNLSLSSSSPSSYTPASSSYNSSSSSAGQYKPLSSSSSRYGNNLTLTSSPTATSRYSSNQDYLLKSVSPSCSLSSSAYSSGSSLSSSGSSTSSSSSLTHHHHHHYTSPSTYVPKSRRLSQTSNYSSNSSLRSTSSPGSRVVTNELAECSPPLPAGVPRGLINLGNTCYMNASLQSLYSIEPFRRLIGSIGRSCDTDKVLTNELAELFKLMGSSSKSSSSASSSGGAISPANFKYAFSHYQSKFSGFGQQDAQEFLRYLVNGIHEESNVARRRTRVARATSASMSSGPRTSQEAWSQYRDIVDDSPLVDLLVGQLCSTITCSVCQNQSHCWDPFWDLSLPLTCNSRRTGSGGIYSSSAASCSSLREILDEFMARETLDSDERPICSRCQRATRSTKQISLSRLPEVLILHLKKFTNDGYKLSSSDIQIDKQLTFNGSNNYQLKAIISHHGHSACSGHYTCHADYQARWFHFNDDRVHDVTNSFMSSHSNNNKLDDAYVLFYTRASATTRRPSISQKSKL